MGGCSMPDGTLLPLIAPVMATPVADDGKLLAPNHEPGRNCV